MKRSKKYTATSLCVEMLETPGIIANFDPAAALPASRLLAKTKRAFFTGEGSSRIFPAKHFLYQNLLMGAPVDAATDGSRQAAEYDLKKAAVFGASNSGKTKEVVTLFRALGRKGHKALVSLSAFDGTPLGKAATEAHVLACGKEEAVAATKSVVEQGLFYHAVLDKATRANKLTSRLSSLAKKAEEALTVSVPASITKKLADANILHWAGRNTGVAEELTLKTNEITRKRSAYLEGTYAVHGIEEVMTADDAVIVVEPFRAEEEKFYDVLVKGVGCTVVAIASRKTRFPTIRIPKAAGCDGYLRLMAGWNLLVEIGLARKVDMDKTVRARKVGNALGS